MPAVGGRRTARPPVGMGGCVLYVWCKALCVRIAGGIFPPPQQARPCNLRCPAWLTTCPLQRGQEARREGETNQPPSAGTFVYPRARSPPPLAWPHGGCSALHPCAAPSRPQRLRLWWVTCRVGLSVPRWVGGRCGCSGGVGGFGSVRDVVVVVILIRTLGPSRGRGCRAHGRGGPRQGLRRSRGRTGCLVFPPRGCAPTPAACQRDPPPEPAQEGQASYRPRCRASRHARPGVEEQM